MQSFGLTDSFEARLDIESHASVTVAKALFSLANTRHHLLHDHSDVDALEL